MPLNFTLRYDHLISDIDDASGDITAIPAQGWMYFEPSVHAGSRIPVPSYTPRPSGVEPRRFKGYLDTDGRLKTGPGGSVDIRLWANDPAWGLIRYAYTVTAALTDLLGRTLAFDSFSFDAPTFDTVLNLVDVMPAPGQAFGRGPGAFRLSGGHFTDGQLYFQNSDGSMFSVGAPPTGVVAFIYNDDGSLSFVT